MAEDKEEFYHPESFLSFRGRGVDFEEKRGTGLLRPQRNVGESTREKVTHRDYSTGGILAWVNSVTYGTYEEKRACLISFRFQFSWNNHAQSFRHAEIEVFFEPLHKASKPALHEIYQPVVRNLSPAKIRGLPNVSGEKWSFITEKLCSTAVKNEPAFQASIAENNTPQSLHNLEITGRRWSSLRKGVHDKACWVIDETGSPTFGIKEELYTAVLVDCESHFQATVKVTVDAKKSKKLWGFPWSSDDPLLFISNQRGTVIGAEIATAKFENLTFSDWSSICSDNQPENQPKPIEAEVTLPINPTLFRIQGIPAEYDSTNFNVFLNALIEGSFQTTNIEIDMDIRSFAQDARLGSDATATLSSHWLASKMGTRRRESILMPNISYSDSMARKRFASIDIDFQGFTILHMPNERHLVESVLPRSSLIHPFNADFRSIIAISGLGAHSFGSFKSRGGTYMWLADELPIHFPEARIMVYGYDTALWKSNSFQSLRDIAGTFRELLSSVRPDTPEGIPDSTPIIFVLHSLGGLMVKQAIVQMIESDDKSDLVNANSIRGMLLFGVPSLGLNIDSLRGKVEKQPNEPFLLEFRLDSDFLRVLNRDFRAKFTSENCKMISFYEQELSPTNQKESTGWSMTGPLTALVTQDSATGGSRHWETGPNYAVALKKNHSELVKFYPHDPSYLIVKRRLETLIKDFPTDEATAKST